MSAQLRETCQRPKRLREALVPCAECVAAIDDFAPGVGLEIGS
jgi:hypothetical protein